MLTSDLLDAARAGHAHSRERVYWETYPTLERLARSQLRKYPDWELDPSDVIHEAYVRLGEQRLFASRNERHYWALWTRAMRHVLLDRFRHASAKKRQHDLEPQPMGGRAGLGAAGADVLEGRLATGQAIRRAVVRLARANPRHARVVRLRVLGGLTGSEIASVLEVSPATVKRDWAKARTLLAHALAA